MISVFEFLQLIFSVIFLGGLHYLYKYYLRPYYLVWFYRRQGIPMRFYWSGSSFTEDYKNAEEHGEFYHTWIQMSKLEPRPKAVGKNLTNATQLMLIDPECIKALFQNYEQFPKHPELFALSKELGEYGLVLAEGNIWKKHRKLLSLAFHYEFLKGVTNDVVQIADELLSKLEKNNVTTISSMSEFKKITGEVIGRIFFGERLNDFSFKGQPLTLFLSDLIIRIGVIGFDPLYLMFGINFVKFGLTKKHRELFKDIKEFRKICEQIVQAKLASIKEESDTGVGPKKGKNIVDLLFEQRLSNPQECLSDSEIIDEYIAFFSDGMDTTGHFIAMATYYLAANPQFKEKIMLEVDKYFADPSKVTLEMLNQMEFTTAFLRETLRLAPPVVTGLERIAPRDTEISGIKIKKDTVLMACHIANHTDPRFHDNPEKFDPDRWLKPSKTQESIKKFPGLFIPFSVGSRTCIGQHLAMSEAKTVLAMFLRKFEFELVNKDYKLRFTQGFLREPLEDVKLKLFPRK